MLTIKPATLATATGLLLLAACHRSPEEQSVANKADMLAADLKDRADNMEAMADTMANDTAAATIRNAADGLDEAADNVHAAADATIDNMH